MVYRVYIKDTPTSSWRDSKILETDLVHAQGTWEQICERLGKASFKLVPEDK